MTAGALSTDESGDLLRSEADTVALGARIGHELEPGDIVALHGGLGAGKTTLARAILRAHLGRSDLEVPSPSFTLAQTYEGPHGPVVHADLYRVANESELIELGYEDWHSAFSLLVEWPDRAPGLLGRPRLDVHLSLEPGGAGRRVVLGGQGPLRDRLERAAALDWMLLSAGWADAPRERLGGDASTRIYHRLRKPSGETALLMISPPRPDGPPIRRGKPYSVIARLAESVHAFVAVDRALLAQGFSAPRILAQDLDAGLLLLEDLGFGPMTDENGPIVARYAEAARCLAVLHGRELPAVLPVDERRDHSLPPYDLDAMLIEVELLLDWYLPHATGGGPPSGSVRASFVNLWRERLADVLAGPLTWTLRDYHSPNLIWLPGRNGLARIGMLDFQDAVLGPPAYDVASLLQDARVTVPPEVELKLLGGYASARRATDPGFDTAAFATGYAIMAAQRATKILGIFARLSRRDGKGQYLAHIPRVRAYLERNLAHPALAALRAWYSQQLPEIGVFGSRAPPSFIDAAPAEQGSRPETRPEARPEVTTGMVLAAGLGTRMRPITDFRPKPLVAVGGQSLIDYALDRLREAGIRDVVVNVHHLADQIEAHLANVDGLRVTVSDERGELLETGGGVKRALPLLGPHFVLLNSDSLWTERGISNLRRLIEDYDPARMDALLLLASRDSLGYSGAGDFELADDGRLARRAPGSTASYVYSGVAVLGAATFKATPDGPFSLNILLDRAIAAGRLFGLPLVGEWLHVGTPEAIAAAEERLAAAS